MKLALQIDDRFYHCSSWSSSSQKSSSVVFARVSCSHKVGKRETEVLTRNFEPTRSISSSLEDTLEDGEMEALFTLPEAFTRRSSPSSNPSSAAITARIKIEEEEEQPLAFLYEKTKTRCNGQHVVSIIASCTRSTTTKENDDEEEEEEGTMRTFQNEMVSSSSTGVDDDDVDDILCDIVTTTAKKRVCVVASKRTGVVSFLLEEETEEERESIHGKCFGERERSNNRLTTLIASAMSDGGVVALLGDANGDVWCARCDDTVRGCVVDKCERREGPELTVGSEYDYSSTPRKGGGSGGEGGGRGGAGSLLASPSTAAARIASKISKKAGSFLFQNGSEQPVVAMMWAEMSREALRGGNTGMNTVQRMFFVAKEKGAMEMWMCSLDSSVMTPEMVCSCDVNEKLAAKTNAFSKVLDSDWISVPNGSRIGSSNSNNRFLSVVLCESLQFAKVAHVFEMAKNTGESSASTLEANLVRSFEIAASECDRVALSRNGNVIVTYSNTSFIGGARGQANATCHYGEHFHKSMVLKESVASVCRSLREYNSFLALDPSRCVWTFSPPDSEEYASPPQATSAQPFTSPIKSRIVDVRKQMFSPLVREAHEMKLDDDNNPRSPYASVSTAYDDSARAADARFVKDAFENLNNYEGIAELAAKQTIAGPAKATKPFAAHSAALVDTLPKRWAGATSRSGKGLRTLLEEKARVHEKYAKFLVDSGAWENTTPSEKMEVLRHGETTFALLRLRALLDQLKMEETEKHRSLLSDIVRFAGEGIAKGDNTLTRLVRDDAIDVDDIFFSRSSFFSDVFWNATRAVVEQKIKEASQQTQRLADDVEYECVNQAARIVSIALECSNEYRRCWSDLYPAQRVSVEENWTSQASARECMRTISKFSIDVFNARKRLDVGVPLFTVAQPLLDASASNVLYARTERSLMEYKSDRTLILPTLLLCARAHVCPAENVAATCESHFGYDELFTFCDAEGGKARLFHYMRTLKAEDAAPFNENGFAFYVFEKIFNSSSSSSRRVSALLRELPDEFSEHLSHFFMTSNDTAKWAHEIGRNEFEKAGESLQKIGLLSEAKLVYLVSGGEEAEEKIDRINSKLLF